MAIPVFRHNRNHDDWEVASVYGTDDCDSMGQSACGESTSGSFGDPALHSQGYAYDGTRPLVRYSVPQQQPQNHLPVAFTRPQWDARYAPGKQGSFIVPPPGVIFPSKDRIPPPQDTYWPSVPGQIATSSDRVLDVGPAAEPPPSSLLFSPSSPPHASSALIKLAPPPTAIAHGQVPHATSVTMSGTVTGANVNTHVSAMMAPPPRYHEVAFTNPARLAEAGCQAHSGMAMNPPRRSGHDVLTPSYAAGAGHASHGPGEQPRYGYEQDHGYERARAALPQMRERRPSVWRRFVRRFGPSRVSVGQT